MPGSPWLVNRREVLASAAAMAFAPAFSALAAMTRQPTVSAALEKPLRWIQLALVEKDPATFDPAWWLDFFQRTSAQGACISAGGMCAFYPTDVPHHHRSDWLGDKDTFGDLVKGCRKLNMSVIARVDPHCIRDEDAQAHPEWVAVDANSQKVRHMVMKDRWLSCALGPCNFEFMPQVLAEIVSRYGVDGIFANRWAGHITCYCDSCKSNFKQAAGLEAPLNAQQPGWAEFQHWRNQRLFEVWDAWDAAVQKINPEVCCLMNMGGANKREMTEIGQRAHMVAADRQGRNSAVLPPWAAGWNAKVFRSVMDNRPVAGITSVGSDDAHRWKDSVQSPAELQLWMHQCIAQGMRPWVVKFCGTLYDRRWVPPVEAAYAWHAANEKYLRNTRNLARVGVVWSPQTSIAIGAMPTEASQMGIYQALVEARIPFEMVYEQLLDPDNTEQFKLLILPNIAALADDQCEHIRQFVQRGGSILATYETSLYDQAGKKRSDFGLADVFGVGYNGKTETLVKNSYINLEHDTRHEILHGFEEAGRTINSIGHAEVKPTLYFGRAPLTRVPSYPDLPMEDVYPREPKTDIPEVYLREAGASRVAYLPGNLDHTFREVLDPDHGRLIGNLTRWVLNEPDVVSVSGPGVVDVSVWQQENSLTVHLVNLTNPMMMKGPIRELFPIGPQQLSMRLPLGRRPRNVRLLVGQTDAKPNESGGVLKVTVPSVTDHEVVAVEF
ncbi:MAG TPA: alpha-amylase family protein [Pirellulales bacterium]|jgi:hypothetical protein|nr:alpha-amylase family protein [Pirellulales bacterium]